MQANNSVVFITGANKGLGLATMIELAKLGYTVVGSARSQEKADEAAKALSEAGVKGTFVVMDAADQASTAQAVASIGERFGKIDVLVNNAGVNVDTGMSATQGTVAMYEETFRTNVFGVVNVTNACLPLLKKAGAAMILNTSSILGSLAMMANPNSPVGGWAGYTTAYCASKAALNMYTIHLARELEPAGIIVHTTHPGWVQTDMGGPAAPMTLEQGIKTVVDLITADDTKPAGRFIHMGKELPW